MLELRDNINRILNTLRNEKIIDIATYDIKSDYLEEIVSSANKKMEKAGLRTIESSLVLSDLEKICSYRISDTIIDCDVALRSHVIYFLAFDIANNTLIKNQSGFKFKLVKPGSGFDIAGDTMNSFSTTVRRYFRKNNQNEEIYNEERYKEGKRELKNQYSEAGGKNYWEVCILDNHKYFEGISPQSLLKFAALYHSVGNLIPVPFDAFNAPRGWNNPTINDYWDLTLVAIYNWYMSASNKNAYGRYSLIDVVKTDKNVCVCEKWLESFMDTKNNPSWNVFVEANFLQDFVNNYNGEYTYPKDLWNGHILNEKKKSNPDTNTDFDSFFSNSSEWILERGLRIGVAVKEVLSKKTNEEILKELLG